MCLAIPAQVLKIEGKYAECDFGGVTRKVNVEMVDVKEGEYVIVHVGFAIQKMNEKEALESRKLWEEILKEDEHRF